MNDHVSPATPNLEAPRYAEIATFLRAPLASDLSRVDLGLIGIPYDGALTNRSGARHGPREVRNQSSLTRKYHHVSRINPFEQCRIADLGDTSLVAKRLAPNNRLLCATPEYLATHGTPATLADLEKHVLLVHGTDHWRLEGPDGPETVRVESPLRTNSSEVIREAVLAGIGIALRSTWDVGPELKSGALQRVLPSYAVGSRVAVYAVYPSRRHMEQKVRAFVDYLGDLYGATPYWDAGLAL